MITLFGEICVEMAEHTIKEVVEEGEREIMLSTVGGDVTAALAIYDCIKDNDVTVIGTGSVASAGIVVLLGGDKRYATKNTRLMTHALSVSGEDGETCEVDEETRKLTSIIADLLVERTGMTLTQAKAMLQSENYFDTEEAVKMGFLHGEYKFGKKRKKNAGTGFRAGTTSVGELEGGQ